MIEKPTQLPEVIYSCVLLILATSCFQLAPRVRTPDQQLSAEPGLSKQVREAVWETALRFYRARVVVTEGDRTRQAHSILRHRDDSAAVGQTPVFLAISRTPPLQPFDSTWLAHVGSADLVAGFCSEDLLENCAQSKLTTYLVLQDPQSERKDIATLRVAEVALNPSQCKRREAIVDIQEMTLMLALTGGQWAVTDVIRGDHAMGSCGEHTHR